MKVKLKSIFEVLFILGVSCVFIALSLTALKHFGIVTLPVIGGIYLTQS